MRGRPCPNCGAPLNDARLVAPDESPAPKKTEGGQCSTNASPAEKSAARDEHDKESPAFSSAEDDDGTHELPAIGKENHGERADRRGAASRLAAVGRDVDGGSLPRRLGKYQLLEVVGRGGMGVVYRARQVDMDRVVALKLIRTRGCEPGEQDALRFVAEAQITGQIEHPNIVPVHDMGTDEEGRPYFVMKFVHGRSLSSVLRSLRRGAPEVRRKFSRGRLLEIFLSVGQATAFAHARGILHRDLKPSNVMIGEFGEVLLMDWGLAKPFEQKGLEKETRGRPETTATSGRKKEGERSAADSRRHERVRTVFEARGMAETLPGTVAGTPEYMPPEQAAGQPEALNVTADVYGLGALLFEILTLQPPHEDPDTDRLMRRVALEPVSFPARLPKTTGGRVPTGLRAIALKALAHDPADRYADIPALLRDMRAFIQDRPLAARPDRPWEPLLRAARRHAAATVAAAAVLALLGLGAAVFLQLRRAATVERLRLQEAALRAAEKTKHALENERREAEKARAAAEARARAERDKRRLERENVAAAARLRAAMKPYLDGRELFLRRRFLQAITQLRRAAELDPSFPLFQLALGEAYLGTGRREDAEKALERFQKAARLARQRRAETTGTGKGDTGSGEEVRALVRCGDVCAKLGEVENALGYYKRAAEQAPEDPYGLTGRARAELLRKKPNAAAAVRSAEKALRSADWLWEAHLLLGRLYAGLVLPDSGLLNLPLAFRHLDSAVDQAGNEPRVWAARARALEKAGEQEAALADYDELLRLVPDKVEALSRRAALLSALGRPVRALRDLEHAVGLRPRDYELRLRCGEARAAAASSSGPRKTAMLETAEKDFTAAVELRPAAARPYLLRARVRLKLKKYHAAVADAAKVLLKKKNDSEALRLRAAAYLKLGDYERAVADYRRGLSAPAAPVEARRDYARALHAAGRPAEAVNVWNSYLKKRPRDAAAWLAVARLLLELESGSTVVTAPRAAKAVGVARKADELARDKSPQFQLEVKLVKAEALYAAGKKDAALNVLEREAFPLAPADPRVHALREKFRR